MKKFLLSILTLVFLCNQFTSAQIVITDFGTSQFFNLVSDFSIVNQTNNDIQFSGDNTDFLFGDILPVDISSISNTMIVLFGTLAGSSTATTNFQIELLNSGGSARIYEGSWSAFNPINGSISLTFQSDLGVFDPTAVIAVRLIGAGSPLETLDFTADQLVVIPEPGTFMLFGFSALGGMMLFYRNRKANRFTAAAFEARSDRA